MYQIQTLNSIDPMGLNQLPGDCYTVANQVANPDAILVRSTVMHDMPLPATSESSRAGWGRSQQYSDRKTDPSGYSGV